MCTNVTKRDLTYSQQLEPCSENPAARTLRAHSITTWLLHSYCISGDHADTIGYLHRRQKPTDSANYGAHSVSDGFSR